MSTLEEGIAKLCHRTHTPQVTDNRGEVVRMLQHNRSPGEGAVRDERVTRQTVNAQGQIASQIDARMLSAGNVRPNFRYGTSLSGQIMSSHSVNAGLRYQLQGIEDRPYWSLDSSGQQTKHATTSWVVTVCSVNRRLC